MVVKRDGREEVFDEAKLLNGLIRACVKREIPLVRLQQLTDEIQNRLRRQPGLRATSAEIGDQALRLLRDLDKVAYIRFASVYRQFEDVEEFQDELARIEGDVPALAGQERLMAAELDEMQRLVFAGGRSGQNRG
jgi:transcriptional repressor NrdR